MDDNLRIEAERVWKVAGSGPICVTDDVTGSTQLVGFFIPAMQMNALGRALGDSRHPTLDHAMERMSVVMEADVNYDDSVYEWDFWIGMAVGIFITLALIVILRIAFG